MTGVRYTSASTLSRDGQMLVQYVFIDTSFVDPDMMTSSNGKFFRVTGHLPHTKASDAELWCFFDLRLKAGDVRRYRAHHDVSVMDTIIGYGVPDTRIFGGLGARLIMQLRH